MNGVRFVVEDFEAELNKLPLSDQGVYIALVRAYWKYDPPLPADIATCCHLIKTHSEEERQSVSRVLNEFFTLGPDGWRNALADAVIAKAREKSENGRINARKRWDNVLTSGDQTISSDGQPCGEPNGPPYGDNSLVSPALKETEIVEKKAKSEAEADERIYDTRARAVRNKESLVLTDSKDKDSKYKDLRHKNFLESPTGSKCVQTNTFAPETSSGAFVPNRTKRSKAKTAEDPEVMAELREAFEKFWAIQVRKEDKARCWAWWQKNVTGPGIVPKIMAGYRRYIASHDLSNGGMYLKYPLTWLKGECWNDEGLDLAAAESIQSEPVRKMRDLTGIYE